MSEQLTAQEIADLVRWSARDTAALADQIEPLIAYWQRRAETAEAEAAGLVSLLAEAIGFCWSRAERQHLLTTEIDPARTRAKVNAMLWPEEKAGDQIPIARRYHQERRALSDLAIAARAYRAAVRAVNGIADAEAALLAAIDAMDIRKE